MISGITAVGRVKCFVHAVTIDLYRDNATLLLNYLDVAVSDDSPVVIRLRPIIHGDGVELRQIRRYNDEMESTGRTGLFPADLLGPVSIKGSR